MQAIEHDEKRDIGLWYLALAIGSTWAFWIPAIVVGKEAPWIAQIMHYVGGAMPFLMTLFMLFWRQSPGARRSFARRVVDPRLIRGKCYLIIFFLAPFLTAVAAGVDLLAGGAGFSLEALWGYADRPVALLSTLLFLLLFGPVPEEVAWRGYALDRLRGRWDASGAALIIGVAWIVWHLPLFFIPGTYQHGLGVGTYAFWLFNLALIPQSIVMVWIVERNQGSILAAILLHFVINATGELSDLSITADGFYVILWWGLAISMYRHWLQLCREAGASVVSRGS